MRADTRDRVVLPILLPIAILVVIALVLWGFSRILLGITHTAATTTALIVAAAIVAISAFAAARPQVRGSTIGAMVGATAGVTMLAGGIALAILAGGEDREEEPNGAGSGEVVSLVAVDLDFDPTSLTVTAGRPFTIAFDNQDAGVQHNAAIYDNPEFSGTPLFDGELVTGPTQIDYEVPPLDAGNYHFLCIVHFDMVGEIEAVERADGDGGEGGGDGAGEGGGDGGNGSGITVTAQNLAFDLDTIELPADAATTVTMDNQDAGDLHNISIYSDASLGEILFQGELITGPASVDYTIGPLPAGEYYFHCDVHPNMNGTVVVG